MFLESNEAVEFALTEILSVDAHRSGAYLSDKRDAGLVVRHPASQDPDVTFADTLQRAEW